MGLKITIGKIYSPTFQGTKEALPVGSTLQKKNCQFRGNKLPIQDPHEVGKAYVGMGALEEAEHEWEGLRSQKLCRV